MNPEGLPNVSRETIDRLKTYADLLKKWNPRINLVSKSTIETLWTRHIYDSTQIFDLAGDSVDHWADLGSGGGFPGLVIAILAQEAGSPARITLVESDARKCMFLRTVIREIGLSANVLNERIETLAPLQAGVVSARALADLPMLMRYVERHMRPDGIAIFPKGANWQKELSEAQSKWNFQYRFVKSETETGPVILSITGVSRV